VAKFLTKCALYDERKMAFLGAKSSGTYGYPIFSSNLFFSLRKVEAKSLELFWQDFIEYVTTSNSYTLLKWPHFRMTKKVAKFGICGKTFDEMCTF